MEIQRLDISMWRMTCDNHRLSSTRYIHVMDKQLKTDEILNFFRIISLGLLLISIKSTENSSRKFKKRFDFYSEKIKNEKRHSGMIRDNKRKGKKEYFIVVDFLRLTTSKKTNNKFDMSIDRHKVLLEVLR